MDCSSVLFLVMGCGCAQVDKKKLVKRNMTELPYWFNMVQTGSAQPAKKLSKLPFTRTVYSKNNTKKHQANFLEH